MQHHHDSPGLLRIGELSRRVGVSAELLRAWERRYGLLSPARTAGGFRLYSGGDEQRVRRMLEHIDAGLSAAEAARLARSEREIAPPDSAGDDRDHGELDQQLREALDRFDDAGAHAALDRLLSTFALETVLRDAVLPYLHDLGERWQRGEASIAQEHFASALLRGRLLGLSRGWGSGGSPLALLACPPGDQHDLGLICFGLALRARGWRITYLGPDTPLTTLTETTQQLEPALVVLSATLASQIVDAHDALALLARTGPLALGGPGASEQLAASIGAYFMADDPVTAASTVARSWAERGWSSSSEMSSGSQT